jgi:hypothetical protein
LDYDRFRLVALGRDHQWARTKLDEIREQLTPEIVAAACARVPQSEIVRITWYTRERVRQICRAAGIGSVE